MGGSEITGVQNHSDDSHADLAEGGISVIVCCHNSAAIIGTTLEYLSRQEVEANLKIEIIVVDNASSDGTTQVAQDCWQKLVPGLSSAVTFKVISEPRLGLTHARFTGAKEAIYPYIIYSDDDNFLAPDYCLVAYQILRENEVIGACGGKGIPVFEESVPPWFEELEISYAWGAQNAQDGYVDTYSLYGAGLVIRRSILLRLIDAEYRPILEDRSGRQLSSGGDEELTMWCKIFEYQLYYTARLQFQHYIKAGRMTKAYLFRFYKAIGVTLAKQIPLQIVLFNQEKTWRARWVFQVFRWMSLGIRNVFTSKTILLKRLDFYANWWRVKTILLARADYLEKLKYLTEFKATIIRP